MAPMLLCLLAAGAVVVEKWLRSSARAALLAAAILLTAASSAILDQHCADVGRDPGQIRRSVQVGVGDEDPSQTRATVEAYVRVGVTDFLLLTRGDDPQAIGERLADQLPRLRELGAG